MLLVDGIDDNRQPPGFAVTFRFATAQKLSDRVLENAEQDQLLGKPLYRMGEASIYLPNDKTIIVGVESFVKKMLSATGAKSGLIDLIKNADGERDHANAFLNVEPVRSLIDENLPPKDQIPFPFQPFRSLPDEIASVVLRLNFSNQENNYLKLNAIDEKSGKKVYRTIEQATGMGRGALMSMIANELVDQPEMMDALEAYDNRVGDAVEEMLKPTLEGRTLTFRETGDGSKLTSVAVVGTLTGMLLPAVQQVREAARRTQSLNNLRQICLAALNYESGNMHFPSNIVDADGKPLLSWRVQILPFLEQNELYAEFHLDEPWDSPHNIKLLDRMPESLRSPNVAATNKTVYLGFQGEGTMFDPKKRTLGFGSIIDGSANTILCVEANENAAIEWTKPEDLPFNEGAPGQNVGGLRPGGFAVVLCDGSTHFVSSRIPAKALANLILRNDGNIVDLMRW